MVPAMNCDLLARDSLSVMPLDGRYINRGNRTPQISDPALYDGWQGLRSVCFPKVVSLDVW